MESKAGKTANKPLPKSRPPRQCQSLGLWLRCLTLTKSPKVCDTCTKSTYSSVPPGFEAIPRNQSAPTPEKSNTNGVPAAEPGNTPEINVAALLQAAMQMDAKPDMDENKPKVKQTESIKLPNFRVLDLGFAVWGFGFGCGFRAEGFEFPKP